MSDGNRDMSVSHVYTSLNQNPVLDGLPSTWSAPIIFISFGIGLLFTCACWSFYGLIACIPCYLLLKRGLKSLYASDEYALRVFIKSYHYNYFYSGSGRIDSDDRSY